MKEMQSEVSEKSHCQIIAKKLFSQKDSKRKI
jgi:hypothetical protein